MKNIYSIIAAALLTLSMFLPLHTIAQSPEKMSFQAVIRNSTDDLLMNAQVGMRISILQGSSDGAVVYTETHTPSTNVNGLVSIEFGGGAGFSSIDWGSSIYFMKTETDPTGGTNYTITGTTQLLSVPYALYAQTSGNGGASRIDDLTDGKSDNDGSNNGSSVFLGVNTGFNDDGSHNRNVGIGYQSLLTNTIGSCNAAIGYQSLFSNTNGYDNTAHGIQTLASNSTGHENTATGSVALFYNTLGNSNTAYGAETLYNTTEGSFNIAVGNQAGYNNINGNSSVFIGYQSGFDETNSNRLYIENSSSISPLIYGEFDNDLLRVNGVLDVNDAYRFPTSDGIENQSLQTDGLGNVSWQSPISPAGLEPLEEGNGIGWRLIGKDTTYYGSIGLNAVDLSHSNEVGDGALGEASFASGLNTKASGETSTAMGRNSFALGYGSTAIGNSTASGYGSMAAGWNVTASGDYSTALGAYSEASGSYSTTFGRYNVGGGDPITWVATDPLFEIGNGEFNNPSNALTVLKNGSITAPTFTNDLINTAGDKALITKEYADTNYQLTSVAVIKINDLLDGKSDDNGFNDGSSIFFGVDAGINDSGTDNQNVGIGFNSLHTNIDGEKNTATGSKTLYSNVFGNNNTATGAEALYSNSFGGNNTATGSKALFSNTFGNGNNAYGLRALESNTTGSDNIAVGSFALSNNTTGGSNTAIGKSSLGQNTASFNSALGDQALFSNTTGEGNTAIGSSALDSNISGDNNTAVGYQADVSSNNLTNATAIGANAVVSQNNSLVLGDNAKVGIGISAPIYDLHVGNGNINATNLSDTRMVVSDNDNNQRAAVLGLAKTSGGSKVEAQLEANGSTNSGPSVIVGAASSHPLYIRTGNLTRMTVSTTGNVGIGTSNPTSKLHVAGNICYTGSIGACSDIRYKKNLIPVSQILPKLKSIGVYTYTWDAVQFPEKGFTKERQLGVIAQELEQYFPDLVQTDSQGYKTVDYAKMSAVLLQGLKEQQDIIESQDNEIKSLSAEIKTIGTDQNSTNERLNRMEALINTSEGRLISKEGIGNPVLDHTR